MARKRQELDREHEVRAVLAGRGVTARSLIDLIHEVNPTDCGFAPSEEQRRYALKSRLQSELVRRFRDELAVLPEADPAIALLRHRYLGIDACHVRLDALDDDASAWARLQLDLCEAAANDPQEEAPAQSKPAPVGPLVDDARQESALERAREALAAWDYEAAHALLAEAVREEGGRGEAPLLLLELLVDTLAFDAEALEAERAFAPEVLRRSEVRLLLAIAAARLGRRGRAEELVRGLESPRAAEVWAQLADGALRAGEEEEAEALLAEADSRAPGLQLAADLRTELGRRREERLRPMCEELQRCLKAGELSAAERLARALLEQRPEHELAARGLREIEAQRRAERAQTLLLECQRAVESEEPSLAASLLAQAAALGADHGQLPQRITALEAAARERARRARAGEVAKLLAGPERERALRAWLDLDEASRAELRGRSGNPMLDWLEELGAPGCAGRARPLVEAVLAFASIRRAAEDERPELVEARLLTHEKLLRELKPYRRFLVAVRARVLEKQRAEAAALVEKCRAALAQGRRDEAMTLLGRLEAAPEEVDLAAVLAPLRAEFARRARLQQLESLAARDAEGAALFEARRAAEQLAREQTGAGRERWVARAEELTGRIQREFRVRADEVDLGARIADLGKQLAMRQQRLGQWIDDTGSCALLVSAFGRWIFVREISLASGRVRRQVSLRALAPVGTVDWQVDGETLWVSLQSGWLLELCWKNWRVLGWHRVTEAVPLAVNDAVFVSPGSRTVWVSLIRLPGGVTAAELDGSRDPRYVAPMAVVHCLRACPDAAAIGFAMVQEDCRLFSQNGNVATTQFDFGSSRRVLAAAVHPRGDGMVALVTDKLEVGGLPFGRLWLADPSAGEGAAQPELIVGDAESADFGPLLCTSLEERCCFVLVFRSRSRSRTIVALGWRDGSLRELYQVEAPTDATLMVDSKSRRVAVRYSFHGEQRFAVLTAQPPTLELDGGESWVEASSKGPDPCSIAGRRLARGQVSHEWPELARLKPKARRKRLCQLLCSERLRGDPEQLLDLCCRLAALDEFELAARVAEAGHERHPAHLALRLCHAESLPGRWAELRALLEAVEDPSPLGPDAEHYYHLLGEARMHLGDRKGALDAWMEGCPDEEPDPCSLFRCVYVASPQAEPLPAEQWGPGAPTLMQTKNALLAADARLAAGDAAGAIRALERPRIVTHLERQCLARLAEAWLAVEPTNADARLRKTVALAAMVAVFDTQSLLAGADRPFPGAWDELRLVELTAKAAGWLEKHG